MTHILIIDDSARVLSVSCIDPPPRSDLFKGCPSS